MFIFISKKKVLLIFIQREVTFAGTASSYAQCLSTKISDIGLAAPISLDNRCIVS